MARSRLGVCFIVMIRRPPRSTLDRSSAASDVYKRQVVAHAWAIDEVEVGRVEQREIREDRVGNREDQVLSLIHISEPTRPY